MKISPLRSDLKKVLKTYCLEKKFTKQKRLFELNPRHPSLHTEKLEPKHQNLYSFRLNRKWRVIFVVLNKEEVEIVDINSHYH